VRRVQMGQGVFRGLQAIQETKGKLDQKGSRQTLCYQEILETLESQDFLEIQVEMDRKVTLVATDNQVTWDLWGDQVIQYLHHQTFCWNLAIYHLYVN
ncbi:hypothetical protein XENOCAPTIV_009243, partial [Xenoophorus captivus]